MTIASMVLTAGLLMLPLYGAAEGAVNPQSGVAAEMRAQPAECYDVSFDLSADQRVPGEVGAELTGDLEGTVMIVFRPEDFVKFVGTTVANGGVAFWTITGGVVSGPLVFSTEFDNRNHVVDRPGSPADVFENTGRHRVLEGVAKANFHYSGTAVRFGPVEHKYHGVLCL